MPWLVCACYVCVTCALRVRYACVTRVLCGSWQGSGFSAVRSVDDCSPRAHIYKLVEEELLIDYVITAGSVCSAPSRQAGADDGRRRGHRHGNRVGTRRVACCVTRRVTRRVARRVARRVTRALRAALRVRCVPHVRVLLRAADCYVHVTRMWRPSHGGSLHMCSLYYVVS